jgi:integral membrane protein
MLRLFRFIALFEGVTTLALFLVAMPLKYWMGDPRWVPPVGALHGGAWLVYLVAMLVCLPGKGFSWWGWLRTFLASLFPFGTFLNDPYIRRREGARQERGAIGRASEA